MKIIYNRDERLTAGGVIAYAEATAGLKTNTYTWIYMRIKYISSLPKSLIRRVFTLHSIEIVKSSQRVNHRADTFRTTRRI